MNIICCIQIYNGDLFFETVRTTPWCAVLSAVFIACAAAALAWSGSVQFVLYRVLFVCGTSACLYCMVVFGAHLVRWCCYTSGVISHSANTIPFLQHDELEHLALMERALEDFPGPMVDRSRLASKYFDRYFYILNGLEWLVPWR